MLKSLLLPAAVAVAVAAASASQTPEAEIPQVQIVSPDADSYLSGPTLLAAIAAPAEQIASVTFSVDGRTVCTLQAPPYECEWDAGQNVTAHQIRVVAAQSGGGRVVRTLRTKALQFAEKVDVDVVQVTVTVMDATGRFVRDIPRSAFRVYEDGRPQAITNFLSDDVPLELMSAVDISGSMTPAMPKLKRAVKEFLGAVPSRDEVTLLGFNDSVFALTRRTTNPAERMRAVDRLAPWGATALYDVIARSVDMLGRQTGRKAIVVFSDGEDQGSHVALDDVERRLQASDVTLYMIGQGRGVSHEGLRKVMERLAAPTGGRVFTTDSVDQLQGAFHELLDELSNQYLLGYQPTNTTRDDAWREIKVAVEGHVNVRARQGYRAVRVK
jgi:Ca-activated chloride channel family protein